MKKGSKKHTVALSTTSSIDKFPKTETTGYYSNPYDAAYKILEATAEDNNSQEYCNFKYEKLDEVFNQKLNEISSSSSNKTTSKVGVFKDEEAFQKDYTIPSSSIGGGCRSDYVNTSTDDVYKKFHENMKTYPAYISVPCATTLNIAFATAQLVRLKNLPDGDVKIINQQLDKLNNPDIIRDSFSVGMDNTKDFELSFVTKSDTTKSTSETVKIRLFNTVIHPEPINTIGVPIAIDGELLVEASPVNVKVKNGTLEINGAKDRFKYLAGITDKEQFVSEVSTRKKEVLSEKNEHIVAKSKNAFEIRLSLVETAADIVKFTNIKGIHTDKAIDKILQAARSLYSFVENKK